MSRFAQLEAQLLNQQAPQDPAQPQGFDQYAAQAGVPEVATPIADDLSLFDRMGQSLDDRRASVTDTFAYATGLEQEQQEILKGAPLSVEEAMKVSPTPAQTAMSFGGDVVGLVWDWAGDGLIEAGQEGFTALPAPAQQFGKDQLQAMAESDVGQQGLKAFRKGGEYWDAFANKFPQEARALAKGFDLMAAGKSKEAFKFTTELTPLKLNRVGGRKVLSPPQGRDKDLYNIITPEDIKKQKLEKVRAGEVTNPQGLTGKQGVVPNELEWRVIDELKKVDGVGLNHTYQQNTNAVLKQIDTLNEQTRRLAAATRGGVEYGAVIDSIRNNLKVQAQEFPSIFGKNGKKAQKTIEDLIAQFEVSLDRNGTSWEGLLRARQELDNHLIEQMQIGTFGSGRKATAAGKAHEAIRDSVNDLVKNGVEGSGELLERQFLLFEALDGVAPKAAEEASTSLGRLMQQIHVHNPTTPLAQASTLLSPLVWAGAVAVSPFVLARQGYRAVRGAPMIANQTQLIRYGLRDVIRETQKAMKMVKDPNVRKQMQTDIKVIATLINTLPDEEGNSADK